jgi:LacI family transcriptional regulator
MVVVAQKPTIGLVAKRAGVSVASVSRVINGTFARPATEKRVRKAIEELGYRPNSAARALNVQKSEQICLSFADVGNPAYLALTRGINRALRDSKYRMILSSSVRNEEEISNHLHSLGGGYADGLIISPIVTSNAISQLIQELTIPTVLIGTLPTGLNIDNVYVDSAKGIELAVDHLREIGKKRVAFVNGPLTTNPGQKRYKGFLSAMEKNKLKFSEDSIFFISDFTSEAAFDELKEKKSLKKFDSIICANDLIAAGLIRILLDSGIAVGQDCAVVGMDNTDLAKIIYPSLTSVDLLAERRGEIAAELLLERMKKRDSSIKRIQVQPRIVIRDSSGKS